MKIKRSELIQLANKYIGNDSLEAQNQIMLKIAVARCARISYETLGDNPKIDYEADIRLHNILAESGHWSPFEHVARVMSDEEYYSSIKTSNYPVIVPKTDKDFEINGGIVNRELYPQHEKYGKDLDKSMYGWCRNFRGFIQYRNIVDYEK